MQPSVQNQSPGKVIAGRILGKLPLNTTTSLYHNNELQHIVMSATNYKENILKGHGTVCLHEFDH